MEKVIYNGDKGVNLCDVLIYICCFCTQILVGVFILFPSRTISDGKTIVSVIGGLGTPTF